MENKHGIHSVWKAIVTLLIQVSFKEKTNGNPMVVHPLDAQAITVCKTQMSNKTRIQRTHELM